MKTKLFVAGAIICMIAAMAYAQTGFAGKWVTDPPAAAAAGGAGAAGGRGGGAAAETRLDLKAEGGKLTGTIFEGGAELVVNEGTYTDKQAKFKTKRVANNVTLDVDWTADLTDSNTITLSRVFPNGIPDGFFGAGRGGGGAGGRGGPGAGAGAGGGAPGAAATPAGGATPAAVPAAGANAGGGAPGGAAGGRGPGGGGGGRGGAPAPVVLHRAAPAK